MLLVYHFLTNLGMIHIRKNHPFRMVNYMVGEVGLEPTRSCDQQILSLSRIPIPPLAQGTARVDYKRPTLVFKSFVEPKVKT